MQVMKPRTEATAESGIARRPMRTGMIAEGCKILFSSRYPALKTIWTRRHLEPPAVLPAEPPMTMSTTRRNLANSVQFSKSAVPKPVVVEIEMTVKTVSRTALKKSPG